VKDGISSAEDCAGRIYSKSLAIVVNVADVEELKALESAILHMSLEIVQLSELSRERDVLFVA
jgi:hypothetical protein